MTDIVHLLPDSIANQIAAGEVVQRPSSVVKELVENAIDAKATCIQLIIKDAGKTLIQVVDNGVGMSPTDARMAFERHATSKIRETNDLFELTTMGFRGEALPSIAAVAQVELKTRKEDMETGTCIEVAASKLVSQEVIATPVGTSIAVKNLFFNIPARRKFLKSNETEKRNILTDFEKIILVYPEIEFVFIENDVEVFRYPASNLRQRIVNVFGKTFNQQLLSVDVDTTIVKIHGYVGKPEAARKTRVQQFFFVNGRYMRNPYFNSAVMSAYEHLLPPNEKPNYLLYFEIDPHTIDVNIHPTKTEVKFESEQPIWQILSAAVKEALGKFNEIPSIDFDQQDAIQIPVNDPTKSYKQPTISVDPTYNPFKSSNTSSYPSKRPQYEWEKVYEGFNKEANNVSQETEDSFQEEYQKLNSPKEKLIEYDQKESAKVDSLTISPLNYQFRNKYIISSVKSGLMLIDQHRAHILILYNQLLKQFETHKGISQRMLFPDLLELSTTEAHFFETILKELERFGFEISPMGGTTFSINGVPAEVSHVDAFGLLNQVVEEGLTSGKDTQKTISEIIALSLAKSAAIPYGQKLSNEEMENLLSQLFALPYNKYTPDGKLVLSLLADDYIDKIFK